MRKLSLFILSFFFISIYAYSADMIDYCGSGNNSSIPPFLSSTSSPLVMFVMARDHKLYYSAYNDSSDVDRDGEIETTYKHSFVYYGLFDNNKCYVYDSSGTAMFKPTRMATDMYCGGTNEWSGNFLNWLGMSRMDVLRKVLYGGFRRIDTATETVLAGTYIPRDAHSWGKEYYGTDSKLLTPYDPPVNLRCDASSEPVAWDNEEKIMLTIYRDGVNKGCGTSHQNLLSTFSPENFVSNRFVESINYNDGQQNPIGNNGNLIYLTEFMTDKKSYIEFSLNTDDGGELEIDNTIITSNYACSAINGAPKVGTMVVEPDEYHRLMIRVRDSGGGSGAILRYRTCDNYEDIDSVSECRWSVLKYFNKENLRADDIKFRAPMFQNNEETMCGLATSEFIETGEPSYGNQLELISRRHLFCVTSESANSDHLIQVATNNTTRIWNWAATERPVCTRNVATQAKFFVRAKVCDSSIGLEENCVEYEGGSVKPTGLLQRFGTGNGDKICSKTNAKAESCTEYEGKLVDEAPMYFGLITGSYDKNMSGGVLRKTIGSIMDEINPDGTFKNDIPEGGSIITTLNRLQINDFNYGSHAYNCGWITNRPMNQGECKAWGNPIGEMYWEALRYLSGKKTPTPAYTVTTATDGGLTLPKPIWDDPYGNFPACSKPSIVVISDIYPSFDNNVPESGELSNYNKTSLFNTLSTNENISGSYFIGTNNVLKDFMCSSKNLSNLQNAVGLCPEEPTKDGTYNTAALALYAKTLFSTNTHPSVGYLSNIDTYSVALASPFPEIVIDAGGKDIKIVPLGKTMSVGGCGYRFDEIHGLVPTGAGYCPSSAIVNIYIESLGLKEGVFRINFEDVEQGADHDMDVIILYSYSVEDDGNVRIKLQREYAAANMGLAMGFIITGTTEDGVYLTVSNTGIGGLGGTWEKVFKPGGADAELLKNPLWFAAKYGGFSDFNGNGVPDVSSEWDENNDGSPDNYHFITNPKYLEEKLTQVFVDITKKVSSGTAVSVDQTRNRGRMINQAVFYPQKDFGSGSIAVTIEWIGQILSYWYYIGNKYENMLEDTDGNRKFSLGALGDKVIEFFIDDSLTLRINKYQSTTEGAKGMQTNFNVSLDDVNYLWNSGEMLAKTSHSSRIVYTNVDGNLVRFNQANASSFLSDFGDLSESCIKNSSNLINYILGEDVAGCRNRTYKDSLGNTYVYKLGDVLNSSPIMVDYNARTGKPGYTMTYVGANDGMLHAFRAGRLVTSSGRQLQLCNDSDDCNGTKLGQEEWAFIPKNALPYLRYLAEPEYCHIYYNDLTPYIIEADTNRDGYVDKKILIGGMRLGGACGAKGGININPPSDTCPDTKDASCVGLSSYYALDITDQNNPSLLWEFTDEGLGFTFSGPAYIEKGENRYVMFLSGPTDLSGGVNQHLNIYVLNLNKDFTIKSSNGITKLSGENKAGFKYVSSLSPYTKTFGGKLFTKGIDFSQNGDTDTVFFGTSQNKNGNWIGNVIGVSIASENPETWKFNSLFQSGFSESKPITTMVEHIKCFRNDFIVFGTGRWFYKADEAGEAGDINYLYGAKINGCKDGDCGFKTPKEDVCGDLKSGQDKFIWKKELRRKDFVDFMERLISDPATTEFSNVAYFSTTIPNADICSFGGKHRTWAVNCATGKNAPDYTCGGYEVSKVPTVLVPTTSGNIFVDFPTGPGTGSAPDPEIREGAAPGSPTPIEPAESLRKGHMLFWIER